MESASRELGKLKDRHLEQAVKYSRALEKQGKASTRERELLGQVGCVGYHHRTLKGGFYSMQMLAVETIEWSNTIPLLATF